MDFTYDVTFTFDVCARRALFTRYRAIFVQSLSNAEHPSWHTSSPRYSGRKQLDGPSLHRETVLLLHIPEFGPCGQGLTKRTDSLHQSDAPLGLTRCS